MQKNKDKKQDISTNIEKINLKEFLFLSAKKQETQIKETLEKIYDGTFKVEQKHIDKVLNVAFEINDAQTYLPHNLKVEKKDNELVFRFAKRSNLILIIFLIALGLLLLISGTYVGIRLSIASGLNIDIDNDGVAELNLDIDNDLICDINCDRDGDRVPYYNLDYKDNRQATFNITMSDGSLFNTINQDTNGDGVCDINCDSNNDGWPDYNIDLDGDGVIDLNMDSNNDGKPDYNIDQDGDGVCDLNCDTNNDGICDMYCTVLNLDDEESSVTAETGNSNRDDSSVQLLVNYHSETMIETNSVFPDDQKYSEIPDFTFDVINKSNVTLYYSIRWIVYDNTYETTNFWYKISGTNGGFNKNWGTAPFSDDYITQKVAIAAGQTQNYTISLTLHGIGADQIEDQGKLFKARVSVNLVNEVSK